MSQAANTQAAQAATAQRPTSKDGAGIVKRSGGAYNVDPRTVTDREGWNVRFDMGDLEELARSIEAHLKRDPSTGGLVQPMGVKRIPAGDPLAADGKYVFEVVRGHRRNASIQMLLGKGVEFPEGVRVDLLDKNLSTLDALAHLFVENMGKPLLPLEEAAAFQRLHDYGIGEAKVKKADIYKWISKQVGRSDIYVWETMQLLGADDSVKEALKDKKIGSTAAKAITIHAKGDKAKQKELVAQAQAAGKDKGKKAELKKALDAAKRSKHAKKGRALKVRPLDEAALSALGASVATDLVLKLKEAGKAADTSPEGLTVVRAWIAQDDKLALAYTLGALEALKASAGMKINLSI